MLGSLSPNTLLAHSLSFFKEMGKDFVLGSSVSLCRLCLDIASKDKLHISESFSVWYTYVSECLKYFFSQVSEEVVDLQGFRLFWLPFGLCVEQVLENVNISTFPVEL